LQASGSCTGMMLSGSKRERSHWHDASSKYALFSYAALHVAQLWDNSVHCMRHCMCAVWLFNCLLPAAACSSLRQPAAARLACSSRPAFLAFFWAEDKLNELSLCQIGCGSGNFGQAYARLRLGSSLLAGDQHLTNAWIARPWMQPER